MVNERIIPEKRSFVIALMILLALAQAAAAGNWPMFMHDPSHSGLTDEVVEPPLELLWKYYPRCCENSIVDSPVVSSGVVYAG